jgi:Flp pilus assembly protein TadD
MVAMLLEAKGQTKDAQQRYEKIVQFDPKAAVASNNLAWIYAEGGGNLDVALQLAQAAVARVGDQPEFLDTLGWVYCKKKLASMAVQPLEAAVQKDPRRSDYRYHLGVAYAGSGKKQKARTAFDDALKIKPNFPEVSQAKRDLDKS